MLLLAPHDPYVANDTVCLQAPREGIYHLGLRTGEQSVRTRLSRPVLLGMHNSINICNDLEFMIRLTCVAFCKTTLKMLCLLSLIIALWYIITSLTGKILEIVVFELLILFLEKFLNFHLIYMQLIKNCNIVFSDITTNIAVNWRKFICLRCLICNQVTIQLFLIFSEVLKLPSKLKLLEVIKIKINHFMTGMAIRNLVSL